MTQLDLLNLRYNPQHNHYAVYFGHLLRTTIAYSALFEMILAFLNSKNVKFNCCLRGFIFELP